MHNNDFNIEHIIQKYSNYVYKVVDNIVGTSLPYQDKEEIVSDVFYLLWKNQNNITVNLKSYLSTIARNCAYSKLRNNIKNVEYEENQICKDQIEELEYLNEIQKKVNTLTEEEQQLFKLYYIYGYKIKEISKMINKSCGNIKVKLYRLRKKLKEIIYEQN